MKSQLLALVACAYCISCTNRPQTYVEIEAITSSDTIFNQIVNDPYQYLENIEDQQTLSWIRKKDSVCREWLKTSEETIKDKFEAAANKDNIDPPLYSGNRLIYIKQRANEPQAVLYQKDHDSEKKLFDPNELDSSVEYSINDLNPSPDGRLIAIGIATIGKPGLDYYIFDSVQEEMIDTLESIRLSKFPWLSNTQIVFQSSKKVGEVILPIIQAYDFKKQKVSTIYEPNEETRLTAEVTFDMNHIVIADGVSSKDVYLIQPAHPSKKRLIFKGKELNADYTLIGQKNTFIYFQTTANTKQGKIIRYNLTNNEVTDLILPTGNSVLDQSHLFGDKLLVTYLDRALPKAVVYSLDGNKLFNIEIPVGLAWSNYSFNWRGFTGHPEKSLAFHKNLGLSAAGSVYEINMNTGDMNLFHDSRTKSNSNVVTRQVFVKLANGEEMPMFVTHKADIELDGKNPTLLYAYGAYGWTEIPFITPKYSVFIESGGIHAMPNLRGGGALGDSWYQNGRGKNKVNTISDAIAAGEWLIDNNYTNPEKLIIEGNSAGTLVAMAAVNQRPELFGAVVLEVPLSDMVRILKFKGGVGWKSQFGDPEKPEDFKVIYSYSPYHNIDPEKDYPPAFIAPGELDQVAHPMHGYKIAAALQEAQTDNAPVILRVNWGGDHNGGNAEKRKEERVDELIFLSKVIGMDFDK